MTNRILATLASAVLLAPLPAAAQDYTAPGTTLKVGEAAVVPHFVPKGPVVPVELTITGIERGSKDDLKDFQLPEEAKADVPYYVRYTVKNVSDEDLSNQTISAFQIKDDRSEYHMPATTRGGGAKALKCEQARLKDFTKDATAEGCLIAMIHESGKIVDVEYKGRTRDGEDLAKMYNDPVVWLPAEDAAPAADAAPADPAKSITRP